MREIRLYGSEGGGAGRSPYPYRRGCKNRAGKVTEKVHFVDWNEPERNDFAIAEEVALKGNHERRPGIVLYVNGIAVGLGEAVPAQSHGA